MDMFTKQSYEEFYVAGDFSEDKDGNDLLASGETIVLGSSVVAAEDEDGTDVSSIVLDQLTKTVSGSQLKILCKAGAAASSPYKITFRIVTSLGNKYEIDVRMVIEET